MILVNVMLEDCDSICVDVDCGGGGNCNSKDVGDADGDRGCCDGVVIRFEEPAY